jgi:hypothetical protein
MNVLVLITDIFVLLFLIKWMKLEAFFSFIILKFTFIVQ